VSDTTTVAEQTLPGGGGVNQPSSGSYGEAASLDRLQKSLPKAQPVGPGAEAGAPVAPLPRTSPASAQSGSLPPALLAPTSMPDTPQTTPLAVPAPNPMQEAQSWRQRNMALLDSLSQSPQTSPATREWAATLKDMLIRASVR
jgi:hypothetical protein